MKKIFAEGKNSTKATFRKDKDTSRPTKLNLSLPHTTHCSWQRPLRSKIRGTKISATALSARHLQDLALNC